MLGVFVFGLRYLGVDGWGDIRSFELISARAARFEYLKSGLMAMLVGYMVSLLETISSVRPNLKLEQYDGKAE